MTIRLKYGPCPNAAQVRSQNSNGQGNPPGSGGTDGRSWGIGQADNSPHGDGYNITESSAGWTISRGQGDGKGALWACDRLWL